MPRDPVLGANFNARRQPLGQTKDREARAPETRSTAVLPPLHRQSLSSYTALRRAIPTALLDRPITAGRLGRELAPAAASLEPFVTPLLTRPGPVFQCGAL